MQGEIKRPGFGVIFPEELIGTEERPLRDLIFPEKNCSPFPRI
jgi:hypothetical protein